MFGISLSELLVIFALALIVLGPKRLPEVAITIGQLLGTLRKSADKIQAEFQEVITEKKESLPKPSNAPRDEETPDGK